MCINNNTPTNTPHAHKIPSKIFSDYFRLLKGKLYGKRGTWHNTPRPTMNLKKIFKVKFCMFIEDLYMHTVHDP